MTWASWTAEQVHVNKQLNKDAQRLCVRGRAGSRYTLCAREAVRKCVQCESACLFKMGGRRGGVRARAKCLLFGGVVVRESFRELVEHVLQYFGRSLGDQRLQRRQVAAHLQNALQSLLGLLLQVFAALLEFIDLAGCAMQARNSRSEPTGRSALPEAHCSQAMRQPAE